jgi:hypothetical protein
MMKALKSDWILVVRFRQSIFDEASTAINDAMKKVVRRHRGMIGGVLYQSDEVKIIKGGREREFRAFGRGDQYDTEEFKKKPPRNTSVRKK